MPFNYTDQTIRQYKIGEMVGRGGQGMVYKATHTDTGETVAVKVILPERAEDDQLIQRLKIEAEIIRQLNNPAIVTLLDYWEDDRGIWLVMDWLGQGNLRDRIQADGPLSLSQAADVLDRVCGALTTAHQANIIHRDLKPENIMFNDDGDCFLMDFSVAKRLDFTSITTRGVVMGSPGYLAPEQVLGEQVSAATDICSLAVVLYEMLTGQHPFSGIKSELQLLLTMAQGQLPSIHDKRDDIPEAVDAVIRKATDKDPSNRYETAIDMAIAFREAAGLPQKSTD